MAPCIHYFTVDKITLAGWRAYVIHYWLAQAKQLAVELVYVILLILIKLITKTYTKNTSEAGTRKVRDCLNIRAAGLQVGGYSGELTLCISSEPCNPACFGFIIPICNMCRTIHCVLSFHFLLHIAYFTFPENFLYDCTRHYLVKTCQTYCICVGYTAL